MNKEEKGKEKKKEEKVNKMRQDNHLFIFTFSDWFEFPFWFFIIYFNALACQILEIYVIRPIIFQLFCNS